MLMPLLLLLTTASSPLCCISMMTAMAAAAATTNEDNGYATNNAIIAELQQQPDTQQLREQLWLKLQQQRLEQEEQQKHQPQLDQQFEPVDLGNLRRLQQINEYYNKNHNKKLQRLEQQQQQQQQPPPPGDQDNVYDKNNHNNNNNMYNKRDNYEHGSQSDYNDRYHFYKFNNIKSANNANNNYNNNEYNANPQSSSSSSKSYSNVVDAAAAAKRLLDASKDFRLQLSAVKGPVSQGSRIDTANGRGSRTYNTNTKYNNNYNNDNNNKNSNSANNNGNKHNNNNNDANDNDDDDDDDDHDNSQSTAVESGTSFAEANCAKPNLKDVASFSMADYADTHDDYDDELGMDLPYGIQNVRKRSVRDNRAAEARAKSITYQSLCPTKRVSIPLETTGYEYRPNHYIEVMCAHKYAPSQSYDSNKNKICAEAGFSCIQLNRTIHLIRRNKAATLECWESEIRIVPSGCECMWPKHNYGDIVAYHSTQKRAQPPVQEYVPGQPQSQPVELFDIDGRQALKVYGSNFDAYAIN